MPTHHKTTFHALLLTAGTAIALPFAATAQSNFHTTDGNIVGDVCIGDGCLNFTAHGINEITLRANNVRVLYDDNSVSTLPDHDWGIYINDTFSAGREYFSIRDVTNSRTPFAVEAGAREDALYIDATSRIGIGERDPVEDLHMTTSDTPTIRLSQEGAFGDQAFDIGSNETNFFVRDVQANSLPIRLLDDTANGMLGITPDGVGINTNDAIGAINIQAILDVNGDALVRTDLEVRGNLGVGTNTPTAPVHVSSVSGGATVLVENTADSPSAVREMFKMVNNGGSYFTLENSQANTEWFFVHENASPNRFIITDGVADGPEMTLTATGNLTIEGQLFTAASCSAGCDRVFDADYPLPSIAEQLEMMQRLQHLPNVGPTPEDGPFNITAMTGGILNELEKAHLYIAQLEQRLTALETIMKK